MLELILEFLSFVFPKAGILLGSIPLTAALVFLAIECFMNIKGTLRVIQRKDILGWPYLILILIFLFTCMINIGSSVFAVKMAEGILYIISPLMVLAGLKADSRKAFKIIYAAIFIVAIFAGIQFAAGIEKTKIPGLTLLLGDSYANKNIGFGQNGYEAVKMPSTYQNGNSMGIFMITEIPIISWDIIRKDGEEKHNVIKYIAVLLSVIAVCLSGSRSVLVSMLIIMIPLLAYLFRKLSGKQILLMSSMIILSAVVFARMDKIFNLGFLDKIYYRYIYTTFFATGGSAGTAGRTNQWMVFFSRIVSQSFLTFIRFIFCGFSWKYPCNVEGVLYVMSYFGVIAFIAFMILLLRPIKLGFKINKFWGMSFLAVLLVLCVDRTYCSTPTLMNYFFMFGLAMQQYKERLDNQNEIKCDNSHL